MVFTVPPRIHYRVKRIAGSPALWKRTAAESFDPKSGREYDEYRQVNSTTSYVSRIFTIHSGNQSSPNSVRSKAFESNPSFDLESALNDEDFWVKVSKERAEFKENNADKAVPLNQGVYKACNA